VSTLLGAVRLNVQVTLKDVSELQTYLDAVHDASRKPGRERELDEKLDRGEITRAQYKAGVKALERMREKAEFVYDGRKLNIEYVPNHYYLPVLLDEQGRADYIKHVIRTESEVRFVRDLEKYLAVGGTGFDEYDWWMWCPGAPLRVSKLDESLDDVGIPYYNPEENRIAMFRPDFVFWLRKGRDYHIVFVDPKGTEHVGAYLKLDGYRRVFEEAGRARSIQHDGLNVRVSVVCYAAQQGRLPDDYRRHWAGSLDEMLQRVPLVGAP